MAGRAWQGLRVSSRQLLHDALDHVELTSRYASDLESVPMEVWGCEEGGEEGGEDEAESKVLESRWAPRVSCGLG